MSFSIITLICFASAARCILLFFSFTDERKKRKRAKDKNKKLAEVLKRGKEKNN